MPPVSLFTWPCRRLCFPAAVSRIPTTDHTSKVTARKRDTNSWFVKPLAPFYKIRGLMFLLIQPGNNLPFFVQKRCRRVKQGEHFYITRAEIVRQIAEVADKYLRVRGLFFFYNGNRIDMLFFSGMPYCHVWRGRVSCALGRSGAPRAQDDFSSDG